MVDAEGVVHVAQRRDVRLVRDPGPDVEIGGEGRRDAAERGGGDGRWSADGTPGAAGLEPTDEPVVGRTRMPELDPEHPGAAPGLSRQADVDPSEAALEARTRGFEDLRELLGDGHV